MYITDKSNPTQQSRVTYAMVHFTHQGWLTSDHNVFIFVDESDDLEEDIPTTTFVLNVEDLEMPTLVRTHLSRNSFIDHNMYNLDGYTYHANYESGLQVIRLNDDIKTKVSMKEVAYFHSFAQSSVVTFNGAWSVYPYFPSMNIALCTTDRVFMVSVDLDEDDDDCKHSHDSRSLLSGCSQKMSLLQCL